VSINLDVKQIGHAMGRSEPAPMLTLYVYLTNKSGQTFDLLGANFWFSNHGSNGALGLTTTEAPATCRPDRVHPNNDFQINLNVPVTHAVLRTLEDRRKGESPGTSEIVLNIYLQPITRYPIGKPGYDGKPEEVGIPGAPECVQLHPRWTSTRDEWVSALKGLGYDELEIFELPVRRLREHPEHAKAVAALRRAQEQFRTGSWNECVLNSRLAVETLGHVSAPEEAKGDGPNLHLLLDRITPSGEDGEPRRKALDKLFLALRELRHPAAHAHLPGRDMERAEAELALSTALTVFRYVGERWSRPEAKR
jgi:HEPN domain-containing protein